MSCSSQRCRLHVEPVCGAQCVDNRVMVRTKTHSISAGCSYIYNRNSPGIAVFVWTCVTVCASHCTCVSPQCEWHEEVSAPLAIPASLRQTLSEASVSAVGSRRSRAAAFGDDTTDEGVACTSRVRGQLAPDEKGVSTSSGETIVRSEGEPSRTDPYCALSMRPGGLGSSPIMPSSHMLVCLGRRSCRRADRRPRGA